MARNSKTVILPSGTTVPADDIIDIQRDAQKDTLRNVFAAIGVFSVGMFAFGMLKAYQTTRAVDDSSNDE